MKGLITRNTHVKYQISSTHCSKVISKVKVFKKWVKLQGQGYRVKNNGTHGKVLSQGTLMWYIKTLALTVQKILARLKFSKNGSNSKVKVTGLKNNGTHGKVLSQGILMWNIKALALTVQKVLARLKFSKNGYKNTLSTRNLQLT